MRIGAMLCARRTALVRSYRYYDDDFFRFLCVFILRILYMP